MQDWLYVGLYALIAVALAGVPLLVAWLVRPKKPGPVKQSTYECGLETIGDAWIQFRVQYYVFALIFVVFDLEVVFLFPWAVAYNQLGLLALVEMFIFIGLLVLGLVYAWRKGALEWV